MNDQPIRPNVTERVKRGDLRDIRHAQCTACKHTWCAPVIGLCPKCKSPGALVTEELMIGAARV